MSMTQEEERIFSDVVRLVNRTDNELTFLWDSQEISVLPGKTKTLPRHIAMKGIERHKTKVSLGSFETAESLFGIDEENSKFPITSLGRVDLDAIAAAPKGVPDVVVGIGGKPAEMGFMNTATGVIEKAAKKVFGDKKQESSGDAPKKV